MMLKRVLFAFLFLIVNVRLYAAIDAQTVWEFNASGTASMVNGGGFNYTATFAITDATATSATGNAPVISSATYTFVAGDTAAWIYVSAGTNWRSGCWYDITSVAGGAATVNATIGAAVCGSYASGKWTWTANTAAGVATEASPTGGTLGIDYSQDTAAIDTGTDLASADGDVNPCVVTSATHNFTAQDVGNVIHITETGDGFTVGWYEIASTAANAATLDRACGTDGAKTGGDWNLGGALSLNSALDDDFMEQLIAGNMVFFKLGSFTVGENVAMAADGTSDNPIEINGYNALRGDQPLNANRPTIAASTNDWDFNGADYVNHRHFIITTADIVGLRLGTGGVAENLKITGSHATQTSTLGLTTGGRAFRNEVSTTNGVALLVVGASAVARGNYIHDSPTCISVSGTLTNFVAEYNILDTCATVGITTGTAANDFRILNNTIAGAATPGGTGIDFNATTGIRAVLRGNIFWGWTTALDWAAAVGSTEADCNNFYNNTTNRTNIAAGPNDTAVNPTFTDSPGGNFALGASVPDCYGAFPGGLTTGYRSMGAVQPSTSGAAGGSFTFIQ